MAADKYSRWFDRGAAVLTGLWCGLAFAFVLGLTGCTVLPGAPPTMETLPPLMEKPDGMCPNLAGQYVAMAWSNEVYEPIGRQSRQHLSFTNRDHPRRTRTVRDARGVEHVVPVASVEIRHLSASSIEVTERYATGEENDRYRAELIGNGQICHAGTVQRRFATSGGSEGGRVLTETLVVLTKEPDGSIVRREHDSYRYVILAIVPGGSREGVLTFRFPLLPHSAATPKH